MYEVIELIWDRNYPEKFSSMGLVPLDRNDLRCITRPITHTACENYILMQFTGLLDKQGKEIYEDDVVRVNGGEGDLEFVSHVIFDRAAFRIAAVYDQGFPSAQDIEVIGNIHDKEETRS